jgi:death-on-curing protein
MTHAPLWVPRVLVDAIHYAQLDEHGGSHGVRDVDALEAALARPKQKQIYASDVDLAHLAAAYAFGLAKSHPYTEGNKRVAFLVAAVFLELNGFDVDRSDEEVVDSMKALAAGKLGEEALAGWLRAAMAPLPRSPSA